MLKFTLQLTPHDVYFDSGDFMDINDDMLRPIEFSEINESAGISKLKFRNLQFFEVNGKFF